MAFNEESLGPPEEGSGCACRFKLIDGWLRLLPESECGYHRALRSGSSEADSELAKDAARYRCIRDGRTFEKLGLFIAQQTGSGVSRWTDEHADMIVDGALQSYVPQESKV